MGLSLDLPNLIHIHILISQPRWWHCCRMESFVEFLNWFVDELVGNLMKYTCHIGLAAANGLRCLPVADLIQVESRVCRPQWVKAV